MNKSIFEKSCRRGLTTSSFQRSFIPTLLASFLTSASFQSCSTEVNTRSAKSHNEGSEGFMVTGTGCPQADAAILGLKSFAEKVAEAEAELAAKKAANLTGLQMAKYHQALFAAKENFAFAKSAAQKAVTAQGAASKIGQWAAGACPAIAVALCVIDSPVMAGDAEYHKPPSCDDLTWQLNKYEKEYNDYIAKMDVERMSVMEAETSCLMYAVPSICDALRAKHVDLYNYYADKAGWASEDKDKTFSLLASCQADQMSMDMLRDDLAEVGKSCLAAPTIEDMSSTITESTSETSTDSTIYDSATDPAMSDTMYDPSTDPAMYNTMNDMLTDPAMNDTTYDTATDPAMYDTMYNPSTDPALMF